MKRNILLYIALPIAFFSMESTSNNQYFIDDISNNQTGLSIESSETEKMSMMYNAPILEAECKITGNSNGCTTNFICPQNQAITAVKVGCNLEWGTVTDSQMNSVRWGKMNILRQTDTNTRASFCRVETDREKYAGSHSISSPIGKTAVSMSCKEHDKNGGDCHVKAQFICSDRF
jgi:hypothetical protein